MNFHSFRFIVPILCILSTECVYAQTPNADAEIRAPYGDSEIVIKTTTRLAGAIHSLTWKNKEFINSTDHGRQLQSASNLDLNTRFSGESFNPTEAGSRADGAGPTSTSQLLHLIAEGNTLQTTSQMAFWLRPGEKSGPNPAKNTTLLSNHLLTKRATIGYRNFPNVIQYNVTFSLPINEFHTFAQFEVVTGYMPPEFSNFLAFHIETGQTSPLSDGPGEQAHPIVFSTESGSHAMAIYSPGQPSQGFENAGYGRWNFRGQKVVKWNSVFRIGNKDGVAAGDYTFQSFVIVGDLETVISTMQQLVAM